MEWIRKSYGVPAKRGMTVKPKVGPHRGLLGHIAREDCGRLVVKSNKGRSAAWISILHPSDVDFLGQGATPKERNVDE